MDFSEKLEKRWKQVNSMLCVGIDPVLSRIPVEYGKTDSERLWSFCKSVVDVTHEYVCAFKPQIAFFAAVGHEAILKDLISYIHTDHPTIPVILDAKRGDIGSTAKQYAEEVFHRFGADAVTVNPYLGWDTVEPFLSVTDRGVIVLCRTSNPGSDWLQLQPPENPIYQQIARRVDETKNPNLLLVVGGTKLNELATLRKMCPETTFLVPGIGEQGGNAEQVVQVGKRTEGGGLIVNVSRSILYGAVPNQMNTEQIRTRAKSFATQLTAYSRDS